MKIGVTTTFELKSRESVTMDLGELQNLAKACLEELGTEECVRLMAKWTAKPEVTKNGEEYNAINGESNVG